MAPALAVISRALACTRRHQGLSENLQSKKFQSENSEFSLKCHDRPLKFSDVARPFTPLPLPEVEGAPKVQTSEMHFRGVPSGMPVQALCTIEGGSKELGSRSFTPQPNYRAQQEAHKERQRQRQSFMAGLAGCYAAQTTMAPTRRGCW